MSVSAADPSNAPVMSAVDPAVSKASVRRLLDQLTVGISTAGGLTIVALIVLLASVLTYSAWPAITHYSWRFLVEQDWDPVEEHFGALPVIYGTIISSLIALVLAVPISIGSAVFLVRLAPRWFVSPAAFLIDLLAAIPSIAYGFWGVAVLVPLLQKSIMPFLKASLGKLPLLGVLFSGPAFGVSMLAAGMVLAIMIIPIITAVTRDVLRAIPKDLDEGAYALGATWWQATLVVLNFGKAGIFGAVMLGLARAVGETMAVTMVIGNRNGISASLLSPAQTMASLLANEFMEADKPAYSHALIYVALVLLLLTFAMNLIARLLINSTTKPGGLMSLLPFGMGNRGARIGAEQTSTTASTSAPAAEKPDAKHIPVAQGNQIVRAFSTVMVVLCVCCALFTLALLGMIIGYIIFMGASSLSVDFFTKLPGPVGTPIGMKNCIKGTLILIGLASSFGVPLGMLCGIYLAEFSNGSRLSHVVRLMVDVLAGTPSIIVGVLVYQLVVVPMGTPSGWAGSLALAFMMCPIIAKTTEEMLRLVPSSYREGSMALGGARFHTLFKVVLPAASSGIVTGIMLAIARIAGETAPLLFTAMGSDLDVYDPGKPFPSLTLEIFKYITSAEAEWKRQAWAGMLVLIFVILVLSASVRYASRNKMQAR
jgi:phosphate transport system permease protein